MTDKPTYEELEQRIRELEDDPKRILTGNRLIHKDEILSALIEKNQLPTAVGFSDGSVIAFNKALEKLTGYKKTEIKNSEDFTNKLHPDPEYREFVWNNVQQVLKGEKPDHTKFEITCKDGSKKTIDLHTSFFTGGSISQMIDITGQRQAEEDVRESEERYRQIFNEMLSSFALHEIIRDDEGRPVDYRFLSVNPAFERITGLKREDVLGRTVLEVSPDTESFWMETYGRVVMTGEPAFGVSYAKEIGKYIELTAYQPLPNQLASTATDITELRKAKEEARKSWEEMVHLGRVATMGELSASLAHELNQPLTAIMSNAQAALRLFTADSPDLDEIRNILNDIVADNRRASQVMQRLRSLFRKEEFKKEKLNINDLIQEVVSLIKGEVIIRNASIETTLDRSLTPVMGDRIQLQQVIINFILNASEAMTGRDDALGKITILTNKEDEQKIKVGIRDSGIGIIQDDFNKIIEPFYTTKTEGMGMGLSINQSIIDAHSGRLWAENNPDKGATFYFTLPVQKKE